jgi:multicomponent Na+:H+ antiporter subunit D
MSLYNALFGNGIPPALILIFSGLIAPFFEKNIKKTIYFTGAVFCLITVFLTPNMTGWIFENSFNGHMIFGQIDSLSRVFAIIFSIITFAGLLFSIHSQSSLKISSGLVYAGGGLGVVLAGDYFTLYIFWEIMALASTFLILDGKTKKSADSATIYIFIHILGGLFLLGGIIIQVIKSGSYQIAPMTLSNIEGSLMFIGIAVNAAVFPVHAWLKDSYPEASPEGAVFLSAFTTKSAVYLFARTFAGTELLIYAGLIMATLPLVYALIENDIRRSLSYCLINQVGFMLVAIGIGTEFSINGAAAHAFSHILYKALLFMTAGAVIYNTGKRTFSELGGLYRYMPCTALFAIIAALSVSFPFFCGYASKSIIIKAVENEHMKTAWILLEFGSAGVFIAAGARFVYGVFFGETKVEKCSEAPLNMILAMFVVSAVSIIVGTSPKLLYSILPYQMESQTLFAPYIMIPKLELLMFALFTYYIFVKFSLLPKDTKGELLDTDSIYVNAGFYFYRFFDLFLNTANAAADKIFIKTAVPFVSKIAQNISVGINRFILFFVPGNSPGKLEALQNMDEYEKKSVYPLGLNAAASIIFLVIIFLIASN